MSERIYRTPRTYGSPTGYDLEVTHYPSANARLAEAIARSMARCDAYRDFSPEAFAKRASAIAVNLAVEWEMRGWMLPVEDAPDMKRDYGAKRGEAASE